jgi:hypothetical protein
MQTLPGCGELATLQNLEPIHSNARFHAIAAMSQAKERLKRARLTLTGEWQG